jgi:hypothetical protein
LQAVARGLAACPKFDNDDKHKAREIRIGVIWQAIQSEELCISPIRPNANE